MSSTGPEESVIVLYPRTRVHLGIVAVLAGGLLLSLAFYAFLSFSEDRGDRQSARLSAIQPMLDSTALQKDVELLKGQMNILITGAMETKIRRLEQGLKSGVISRTDLATVQELKEDLKVLKAYSVQNASMTFGSADGSEKREGPMHAEAALYSDELLHEISRIRALFYISIASWGFAIVLFAGNWFTSYHRLRQIRSEGFVRRQMLGKPKIETY